MYFASLVGSSGNVERSAIAPCLCGRDGARREEDRSRVMEGQFGGLVAHAIQIASICPKSVRTCPEQVQTVAMEFGIQSSDDSEFGLSGRLRS